MKRVSLVFFLLYVVLFVLGAVAVSAPFVIKVSWTLQGATMPTVRVGFVLSDISDSNWRFHWRFCTDASMTGTSYTFTESIASVCDELRASWLASSLLWGFHLLLTLVLAPLLFKAPHVAVRLVPWGFTTHVVGGFLFVLRVPPLIREVLNFTGSTVGASWTMDWAAGVAIASISSHFVLTLLVARFLPTFLRAEIKTPVVLPSEQDLRPHEPLTVVASGSDAATAPRPESNVIRGGTVANSSSSHNGGDDISPDRRPSITSAASVSKAKRLPVSEPAPPQGGSEIKTTAVLRPTVIRGKPTLRRPRQRRLSDPEESIRTDSPTLHRRNSPMDTPPSAFLVRAHSPFGLDGESAASLRPSSNSVSDGGNHRAHFHPYGVQGVPQTRRSRRRD